MTEEYLLNESEPELEVVSNTEEDFDPEDNINKYLDDQESLIDEHINNTEDMVDKYLNSVTDLIDKITG